ncbi:uncharacterized protein [Vicugna pacos]|uniref:Uncharacterized protein isoform X3 n=1 Tax=Vicugna pacos TaxID=30538 RepID=A0ABM5BC30_VICPA
MGREKVKLDTHPLLVVWKAKAPSAREVPPLSGCSFYRWNTIRTDRHLKWVEDNVARNGLEQGPWAVESAMNQTPVDKATWKGPPPRPSRTNSWAAEAAAAHRAAPSPGSLCSLPGVLSTANFPVHFRSPEASTQKLRCRFPQNAPSGQGGPAWGRCRWPANLSCWGRVASGTHHHALPRSRLSQRPDKWQVKY